MKKLIIPLVHKYKISKAWMQPNGSKANSQSNSQKPLVSVITIVRNAEETIEKTLLSVGNQSYKNFEYIVVDGLSTDGTTVLLNKHNKLISKWVSEKDDGTVDAVNKGICIAKGEIIFLLCADDWIKKDTLAAIIDGFNKNKNCSFVYGDMTMVAGNNSLLYVGDYDYKKNIKKGNPSFNYPSVAYRKDLYDKVGLFSQSFPWNNDYEFHVRVYANNLNGRYIPKFNVYRLPGGQGETNMMESFTDILTINYIYKLPLFKTLIRSFIGLCTMYLKQTLSRGKKILFSINLGR